MSVEIHGAKGGGGSLIAGYGVCSTSASTAQKTVSVDGFELKTGYHIAVTFNNTVGNDATLNVNGTGARYIRWHGSNLKANAIPAGDTCELVYNGNYWYLLSSDSLAASGGFNQFAVDSWATIASRPDYRTVYGVGDTKDVTLSTGEVITMRIEAFDRESILDSGKSRISMLMKDCLRDWRRMNSANTNENGMWSAELYKWLNNDFYNQLPSDLKPLIKLVEKECSSGGVYPGQMTVSYAKIWIPTFGELNFPPDIGISHEYQKPYPLFTDNLSRRKGDAMGVGYWTGSPYAGNTKDFISVDAYGGIIIREPTSPIGVVAGFNI